MFSRVEITVPTQTLKLRSEALAKAPGLAGVAFKRDVSRLRSQLIKEIATPIGAHKRPTDWQSAKQRGYFFWALKQGIIKFTGRTGQLAKGWKTDLVTSQAGGVFTVFNQVPYKQYVQGQRQQRMHRGVWRREDEVVEKYRLLAKERLFQTWRSVTDVRAGVR